MTRKRKAFFQLHAAKGEKNASGKRHVPSALAPPITVGESRDVKWKILKSQINNSLVKKNFEIVMNNFLVEKLEKEIFFFCCQKSDNRICVQVKKFCNFFGYIFKTRTDQPTEIEKRPTSSCSKAKFGLSFF